MNSCGRSRVFGGVGRCPQLLLDTRREDLSFMPCCPALQVHLLPSMAA